MKSKAGACNFNYGNQRGRLSAISLPKHVNSYVAVEKKATGLFMQARKPTIYIYRGGSRGASAPFSKIFCISYFYLVQHENIITGC